MKRSIGLAFGLSLALLPAALGACSSSGDDSAASTTTEAVESTTTTAAKASTSTTAASGASTSTTAKADACADVTEAQVTAAAPNGGNIDNWKCETDAEGRPWVGATASNEVDYNFILETGADQSWVAYDMADCTNPPVPAGILTYCESS